MKKKLTLESLEVTSFETDAAMAGGRGTVHGNSFLPAPESQFSCPTTPDMDCTRGCTRELCTFTEP